MRRPWESWPWRAWALSLISLSIWLVGFGPCLTTADVAGERLWHIQALMLTATMQGPSIEARAAILYDVDADQILYQRNAHDRLPPASTTKIATALVALQRADPTLRITVGEEVAVEGMRLGLSVGDVATLEKLLYGVLMNSGNDAAMAIAKAVGGTTTQFVLWMNELASSLGLHNTHFVNPHGLDAEGHYSSAYDLMVLTREALKYPLFAKIVATSRTTLDGWTFSNTNDLLGAYPDVDGVKTGTTDLAGECLVASATRNGHRVVLVILGSSDRYAEARQLLDYYFDHYRWHQLALPANDLTTVTSPADGRRGYLLLSQPVQAFLPTWQLPWLRSQWTWKETDSTGTAIFTVGEQVLATVPLVSHIP